MECAITFSCEFCHKIFSQKSSRNRHVKENHLQPGLYQCKKCGFRFSKKYNFQMHLKHVHSKNPNTNSKQLKCSQCGGLFNTLATLKRHVKDQHESVGLGKNTSTDEDCNKETDAQAIAESVLKELKQLQKEIQRTELNLPKSPVDEQEPTATVTSTLKVKTIKDNLYPLGHFKMLEVQAIKRIDGVTYLRCDFCSKEFKKSYNFLRHLRIHTKIRPFICVLCKKSFSTIAQLKTHCSKHKFHETFGVFYKLYKCPQCEKVFSAMQQLDKHLSSSLTCCNITFKCPECLKSFKTLKTLLNHRHLQKDQELELLKKLLPKPLVFTEDKQDFYDCNLCGLQLNGKILLQEHEKRHDNLFKHQCTECQKSYATQTALKIHTKTHFKPKYFKCQYCYKTFKKSQNCRSHMMTHLKMLLKTPESPSNQNDILNKYPTFIVNQENGQIINTETLLIKTKKENKLKIAQTKDVLKYNCSKCDKRFRYNAWLKKHFKYKHTAELIHECEKCLRKFRTKQSLENHLIVHSTQRIKLTCQVCGRKYASSKSLKLHLRIHTQEKPFTCNQCSKLFRTSGHLIQHRKSNHKE